MILLHEKKSLDPELLRSMITFLLLVSGIGIAGTSIKEYWQRDYAFTYNRIKDQIDNGTRLSEGEMHPYVLDQHTLIWESDNDPLATWFCGEAAHFWRNSRKWALPEICLRKKTPLPILKVPRPV